MTSISDLAADLRLPPPTAGWLNLMDAAADVLDVVAKLDTARPECPTCGGSTDVLKPHPTKPHLEMADNCRACTDGRVPLGVFIDQLLALWTDITSAEEVAARLAPYVRDGRQP